MTTGVWSLLYRLHSSMRAWFHMS